MPDLYGDGKSYTIGVVVIGGGGSGTIACFSSGSPANQYASGGASGYSSIFLKSVIPGTQYNGIVGEGGRSNTSTSTDVRFAGYAGSSSSFAGVTANGGEGGGYGDASYNPRGGQCANYGGFFTGLGNVTPYGGINNFIYKKSSTITYYGKMSIPSMCVNPFEANAPMLAAGGTVAYSGSGEPGEQSVTLPGGTTSAGVMATNGLAVSVKGTLPGCGGGGAYSTTNNSGIQSTATSAPGADGAVFIYAMKVSS